MHRHEALFGFNQLQNNQCTLLSRCSLRPDQWRLLLWQDSRHARCRFAPSRDNPKLYANDYEAVFIGTVREALLSVDPDVVFVDSSPSKGVVSVAPYVKRCGSRRSHSGTAHAA